MTISTSVSVNKKTITGAVNKKNIIGTISTKSLIGEADKKIITGTINPGINISFDILSAAEPPAVSLWKYNQTPTPTPDGSQTIFTLPNGEAYESGTLRVYKDGLRQIKNTDYTEILVGNTFVMTIAPDSDEVISIDYLKTS